ncbi:unnamed protein product [Closterium sp. Yama58-4]|nr:unnamed protein product [Closterium sp. Yama58-4]
MEGLPADDDSPQALHDEPPLPAKPTEHILPEKATDAPRSGLDFLRTSGAPVTPDAPSKDPPPPSPSPPPSTVRVSLGPLSASSTPKRARSGKWSQKIAKSIESTTGDLKEWYLSNNKPFGGEVKSWLVNFLKVHKEGGGKQLCRRFAWDCVDNLNNRLEDLGKLGPTKLFRAGKWPKIKAQREEKCREWLLGCSKLFRNKLPGFDIKAAERELPTFCAIMETHHELESFSQGLSNFLGYADSKR